MTFRRICLLKPVHQQIQRHQWQCIPLWLNESWQQLQCGSYKLHRILCQEIFWVWQICCICCKIDFTFQVFPWSSQVTQKILTLKNLIFFQESKNQRLG